MSKTILAHVDGFTPLIDEIVKTQGVMAAAVFGRIWRYCQMDKGTCTAAIDKIAKEINVNRMTVIRHAATLCRHGYLKDLTPQLRNHPHTYLDTGKAGIKIDLKAVSQKVTPTPAITKSDSRYNKKLHPLSQKVIATITKSDLKKQIHIKKPSKRVGAAQPRDPLLDHPAVILYREIMKVTPNDLQRGLIADGVGESDSVLVKWRATCEDWRAHGWNVRNVKSIVDKFAGNGENLNGKHQPDHKQVEYSSEQLAAAAEINRRNASRQ